MTPSARRSAGRASLAGDHMIGRLEGRIHQIDPGRVLVDVGGVGYLVSTTLRAIQELARARARGAAHSHPGSRTTASSSTAFPAATNSRPSSGSSPWPESVLGSRWRCFPPWRPTSSRRWWSTGDLARLTMTPGVGKKTAQRILLELKGKLSATASSGRRPPRRCRLGAGQPRLPAGPGDAGGRGRHGRQPRRRRRRGPPPRPAVPDEVAFRVTFDPDPDPDPGRPTAAGRSRRLFVFGARIRRMSDIRLILRAEAEP